MFSLKHSVHERCYTNKVYYYYLHISKETHLILVEYLAMMEVGMREYPIDATTDGAQLGHR